MSGLDTSQQITDEFSLHEGHVHAEEKAKAERDKAAAAQQGQQATKAPQAGPDK